MEFNVVKITELESEMVRRAEEKYGKYYLHASTMVFFLGKFLKSIDPDRYVFAMFLSQIKKHAFLALLSTLRRHHVQTSMDLRQVLEAASCAAFAIANPNERGFAELQENGYLEATEKLKNKRYKWLDEKYPDGSKSLHKLKTLINSSAAHSSIIYAQNNFKLDIEKGKFEMPFFDFENIYLEKTDLWHIANIVMGVTDLFYGIAKDYRGITFSDDFIKDLNLLKLENDSLKLEMMEEYRYLKTITKNI